MVDLERLLAGGTPFNTGQIKNRDRYPYYLKVKELSIVDPTPSSLLPIDNLQYVCLKVNYV